ncbi:MAG: hypothetical protein IKF90_16055 [Parasporobacterium sp.]|nr:hypothetical protein [Parasporobacterium sp.]
MNKLKTLENKALTPQNKGPEPGKERTMNSDLQKVMDMANSIEQAKPETREQYLRGIEEAQKAQARAAEAKETAETEKEFNKACDDESHARDKEQFYKRMLAKLDYDPRMKEEDYYSALSSVHSVVVRAAQDFKEIARKAISELVSARRDYTQLMKDADYVLDTLDKKSNVLQSKYRYRKTEYTNGTFTETEDPNEWQYHITRYYNGGKGLKFIMTNDRPADMPMYQEPTDYISSAAWQAAERFSK